MQQPAKISSPAAPAPAAAPQAPAANVVTPKLLTSQDISALQKRKDVLGDQLNSATSRRSEVRRQLQNATGVDKAGLEGRLSQLDARIVRIETDIDENGKQLASLDATRVGTSVTPPRFQAPSDRASRAIAPIGIVFTLFVLAPMAFSLARIFWKRGSFNPATNVDPEQRQRLERMEQAIDSIAIEVERVSEGQRFVTRILAEGNNASALGAGISQAERIPVQR